MKGEIKMERRNKGLTMRLTIEEHKAIKMQAVKKNMSIVDYIVELVKQDLQKEIEE